MPALTMPDVKQAIADELRSNLPSEGRERVDVVWGNWHEVAGRAIIIGPVNRVYTPDQMSAEPTLYKYQQDITVTLTVTSGNGYPTPESADRAVDDVIEQILTVLIRGDDAGNSPLAHRLTSIESVFLQSVASVTQWDEAPADKSSVYNVTIGITAFAA